MFRKAPLGVYETELEAATGMRTVPRDGQIAATTAAATVVPFPKKSSTCSMNTCTDFLSLPII